jgi:hypothetical protein
MGVITGVLGRPWRADVTAWGAVVPQDGSPALDWHVAADDRWHTPEREVAVRQRRLLGAPVAETRARIPGGDAVHRVWTVADDGGCTLVEVTNDSPLPIAVAFTRRDVLTSRPPAHVPIEGIDLPAATTVVVPIGHRTSVTIGLAHDGRGAGTLAAGLPTADATARGWVALTERASRLVLPDPADVERVVASRCDLLLAGPPDDPVGYLLGVGELVRMGEVDDLTGVVPDVAASVESIARSDGPDVAAALDAAALVLARAGESRALRDLGGIRAGIREESRPDTIPAQIGEVERRLARGSVLLPEGIPAAWRGTDFEAHGLVAGPATTLSFAVRWHGANPAVLWQVDGAPVELTAPAVDPTWRTTALSGEALWRTASHRPGG